MEDTNVPVEGNINPPVSRMRLGSYSAPSLSQIQGRIYEEARRELRFPESMKLFKQMLLDNSIASAVGLVEMMIGRVPWKIEAPSNAPEEEKIRCEVLKKNMHTMERPWDEYINEFLSYIYFGFNSVEKIYEHREDKKIGKYVGWKDFITISQDTVGQWVFNDKTGELLGLTQDLSRIMRPGNVVIGRSGPKSSTGTPAVPRKKFLLFRHNPKRNNPEGNSSLKSVYIPWKYKTIIEELEVIGAQKDLGGIPVIGIDADYLQRAYKDPKSPEAVIIDEMTRQAANLNTGDQAYVIYPIAYGEGGKPLFSFKLQGIEGGGKQYQTGEIVGRHNTSMLMAFFADVLKLGNDSHGSFSLADSKTSLLAMGIEYHLKVIQRELNHDLIRQTYELNKWEYDPETACRFVYGDIEDRDIKELSAALQRVAATGLIRPTQDIEDYIRESWMGLGPVNEESTEFLDTRVTSRSGDGMKEGLPSGVGSAVSEDDDSISNLQNDGA